MRKLFFCLFVFIFKLNYGQVYDNERVNFDKVDQLASYYNGNSIENLPLLAYNLTNNFSNDIEKFRAIFRWVTMNIKADKSQNDWVSRKKRKYQNDSLAFIKWNEQNKKNIFKKLLIHKKTMCTGYSYLIKELSFLSGIECVIIDGYARSTTSNVEKLEIANHSWNAVKLNNKWYLCDATWASGYLDDNGLFIQEYNDGYFLTDPLIFAQNHFPLQRKWLLNEMLIQQDFIATPLVYGAAIKNDILIVCPEKIYENCHKDEEIEFCIKSSKNAIQNTIQLIQFINEEENILEIKNLKNDGEYIKFQYSFTSKGLKDVHLKINDEIIASYTFEVLD